MGTQRTHAAAPFRLLTVTISAQADGASLYGSQFFPQCNSERYCLEMTIPYATTKKTRRDFHGIGRVKNLKAFFNCLKCVCTVSITFGVSYFRRHEMVYVAAGYTLIVTITRLHVASSR